jgi:hypothetical protein
VKYIVDVSSLRREQMLGMERFNHTKLNDAALKEQYQLKISNTHEALENFEDDDADISRAWEI